MQIAIDGPAGVGKSTVAKELAKALDYIYLDTGAMYRAIAFKALEANGFKTLDEKDNSTIESIAQDSEIRFDKNKVFINDSDVTDQIRTREVSSNVSFVAANEKVRKELVKQQRKIAEDCSVVMDGRDIGTVVLPEADFKFFLEASPNCRALRRAQDLNIDVNDREEIEKLEKEIIRRDHLDSTRKVGPLKKADDAIVIITDELNPQEVLLRMLQEIDS